MPSLMKNNKNDIAGKTSNDKIRIRLLSFSLNQQLLLMLDALLTYYFCLYSNLFRWEETFFYCGKKLL